MQCLRFKMALAASIAIAFSLSASAQAQSSGAAPAARINTSSISNNGSYNRFIVRYAATTPTGEIAAAQNPV